MKSPHVFPGISSQKPGRDRRPDPCFPNLWLSTLYTSQEQSRGESELDTCPDDEVVTEASIPITNWTVFTQQREPVLPHSSLCGSPWPNPDAAGLEGFSRVNSLALNAFILF